MKLNGHILAWELKGVERSLLQSEAREFLLTGVLVWHEEVPLRECYVYIMEGKTLDRIPGKHPPLTIVSIGEPEHDISSYKGMDILIVKKYLTPEILLSMLLKIFEKYRNFETRLDNFCREGRPFTELSEVLLPIFHNPLVVLGEYMEILGVAQDRDMCRIPCEFRQGDTDFLTRDMENSFRLALEDEGKREYATEGGIPFLAEPVAEKGNLVMGIFLLSVTTPLSGKDRIMLWKTGEYLKGLRRVNFTNRYQGMRRMQDGLASYMQQNGPKEIMYPECLEAALFRLSWKMRDKYICIGLKSAFSNVQIGHDIPDFEIFSTYSMMVETEKALFFICNLTILPYGMEEIGRRLEKLLEISPLFAGISTPFSSFFDFPDYCTQARAAIHIGSKLDYTRKVCFFKDYALDYIIYEGWKSLPMSILLFGGLKDLLLHDYIHHTWYYRTLEVLFENYMVMSRTASQLGIHISTLKYRVKRIFEMLDLDLNDTYNKMYLQSVLFLLKQDTNALEAYLEQESRKRLGCGYSGKYRKQEENK